MNKQAFIEQDFLIDRLTNSILNVFSGDSFQTEVSRLTKANLKYINKDTGWNFDWGVEFNEIKRKYINFPL